MASRTKTRRRSAAPRRASPRTKKAPDRATAAKLETYRKKRDFTVTSEPAPGPVAPSAAGAASFMVHKHDATRLHYDLRLEIEGVLASWAIPKGPSYDPGQKRLAVETEDHPLEYGQFEGRIPEGEYGAGDSIIWDEGTFDTVPPGQAVAQRKKGHLHVRLAGQKLVGEWHLVRTRAQGGKQQWLCFKAKDGTERADYDVVAERPESVRTGRAATRGPVRKKTRALHHRDPGELLKAVWPPMLATLSKRERAPASEYLYEVKYDGYRGLAAVSGGKLVFHTRNGLDLSGRFPKIARALERLDVAEAVLDGEVVALDPHGVSRFQKLHETRADERFVAFDLLWLDGEDLRGRPLEERRDLLTSVLANVPLPIQVAERVEGDVEDALAQAERLGYEGLIAKRRGSRYVGKRSGEWQKLKLSASQEVAIAGYVPISNGRAEIGALLIAVFENGRFRYAGKVGTGYTTKLRKELKQWLDEDRVERPSVEDAPRMRDAIWVRPRLVAQVAFTEWTTDGKLRHPSFLGLREDKKPEEAIRETATSAPARGERRHTGAKAARTKSAPAKTAEPEPEVPLTSGDRIVYPRDRLHKRDVFAYYRDVAPLITRALFQRPIALQQFPKGIAAPGFFRQQVKDGPEWLTRAKVPAQDGGKREHLIVDREATVLWLANQSALVLHMWSSRVPHLTEPDWVVFDLDPGDGTWAELVTIATSLREMLEELGLESVPKTTGKRGLHVLVPLARGHTPEDALDFAVALTRTLERRHPKLATTERTIRVRKGRLYLDAFQNGVGKTIVAPYSLRPVDGAPVSTPLRWDEVTESLRPQDFNLRTVRDRLDREGDLFERALAGNQRLPRLRE